MKGVEAVMRRGGDGNQLQRVLHDHQLLMLGWQQSFVTGINYNMLIIVLMIMTKEKKERKNERICCKLGA
jgi:hypothetical protein